MHRIKRVHGSGWLLAFISGVIAVISLEISHPQASHAATVKGVVPSNGIAHEGSFPSELPLSLHQCVVLALQNSMEVRVERLDPLIKEEEARREASAFFAPRLNFDVGGDHSLRPTGTVLSGAQILETQNIDVNAGISMRSSTGGVVSLDFRNKRFESNSVFQAFDPQYTAELALTLNHPLLKNFGTGFNAIRIKLAQNATEMSKQQLKSVITGLISDVQQTYWDLVMARRDLAARRQSVGVTQYLHKRAEEMVANGRLPALAILQAKSAVLEREIDFVAAENAVDDAQAHLKSLLNLRSIVDPSKFTVVPLDPPPSRMQTVSVEEGLKAALANRPELFQARLDQENRLLGVSSAKNQRLPEVNFVGGVGLSGLSGSPTPIPFSELTLGGIPIGTFFGAQPSSFEGGYDKALSKLLSGNFVSYKVGVTVQIPLGNQAARNELARAQLEAEKARGLLRSAEEKIALEVDRAARAVNSSLKAIESVKALRELTERKLQMAQDGLGFGVSSVTDVLEAEKNLTLARRDEVKVFIDYQKKLVLWEKVTGVTLERFQILL